MNDFKNLHPICIFSYFVAVIVLVLACNQPLFLIFACAGAILLRLSDRKTWKGSMWKWLLPLVLFIAVANPLLNHRGVTRLGVLFGQWITLEAVCYGIVAGLSLATLILWFSCYQKIMTSDKFLYLFGKIAPASSLLITMALAFVPKLQGQLRQIQECQNMISGEGKKPGKKLHLALQNMSTLLGWSLENTVEQADSMKARGYGLKRRTTFHLFYFRKRDIRFLIFLLLDAVLCLILRFRGCGTMEFYPKISVAVYGKADLVFYICVFVLVGLPAVMEWKEELLWRSYNLNP